MTQETNDRVISRVAAGMIERETEGPMEADDWDALRDDELPNPLGSGSGSSDNGLGGTISFLQQQ